MYFRWKALKLIFVSISGFSDLVSAVVEAVETTDMGVSPCHAFGVSPPLPKSPDVGVMLIPLLPRSFRPSGPGVITSVSFFPATEIHSGSCESSASR